MKYRTVLFDLDGTITDPFEGITNSIIYSLKKMNIDHPENEALKSFIGPPLSDSYKEHFNLHGEDNVQVIQYYREYFSEHGLYENTLYNGMDILLSALKDQNMQLFVATTKPTFFAEKIIEHFNLSQYFTAVIGSNMDGTRTDKAEIIRFIIDQYKINPDEAVMIGDRKFDIIGAKRNHMDSIGVLYGHGEPEELRNENPDYICATVESLYEIIQN